MARSRYEDQALRPGERGKYPLRMRRRCVGVGLAMNQQHRNASPRRRLDRTHRVHVELSFPLPPAPPGEPGYAPSDVARLMKLLTTAPDREQLTALTFSHTTTGGYHTGTVDALRQAWIDALPTKQP